jgi:adenylate cyclase
MHELTRRRSTAAPEECRHVYYGDVALVSEIRVKNRLARTLLETYVGSHAGELILAGATRRGSGTTVRAAIMICDLRDFTGISDNWPRDDVIDLLNGYFDAMSEPIARHGGEILKFIGDGLLAIFPLSQPSACANLLRAVTDARQAMVALNEKNSETGRAPLNYGIGVHVGDVMYGNIGSRTRLDFTVIGPAVNMASRLETLTKQLGRPVLLSRAFADLVESEFDLERVGEYRLQRPNRAVCVSRLRADLSSGAKPLQRSRTRQTASISECRSRCVRRRGVRGRIGILNV